MRCKRQKLRTKRKSTLAFGGKCTLYTQIQRAIGVSHSFLNEIAVANKFLDRTACRASIGSPSWKPSKEKRAERNENLVVHSAFCRNTMHLHTSCLQMLEAKRFNGDILLFLFLLRLHFQQLKRKSATYSFNLIRGINQRNQEISEVEERARKAVRYLYFRMRGTEG